MYKILGIILALLPTFFLVHGVWAATWSGYGFSVSYPDGWKSNQVTGTLPSLDSKDRMDYSQVVFAPSTTSTQPYIEIMITKLKASDSFANAFALIGKTTDHNTQRIDLDNGFTEILKLVGQGNYFYIFSYYAPTRGYEASALSDVIQSFTIT